MEFVQLLENSPLLEITKQLALEGIMFSNGHSNVLSRKEGKLDKKTMDDIELFWSLREKCKSAHNSSSVDFNSRIDLSNAVAICLLRLNENHATGFKPLY